VAISAADVGPDSVDPTALAQLHLLEGEHLRRVWRTVRGFLVMTNLRCVDIAHRPAIFGRSDWETGPSLFFYNFAPPRVVLGRYLRLSESRSGNSVSLRFFVHSPTRVAAEIEEARHRGQNEWLGRRSVAEATFREDARRRATNARLGRVVVKIRCGFCGNLMDETAARCPFCGAPMR